MLARKLVGLFTMLVAVALPTAAQTAKAGEADTLRVQIELIVWLNGLDLPADEARAWAKAVESSGDLLLATEAQENAPSVLEALRALRAKALRGDAITDEDWETVEEARCRVVNAKALDEPAQRRQQALLPLTGKLVATLTKAQQLVLAEPDMLAMAVRVLGLIAVGQRGATDEWRQHVKSVLSELKSSFGDHGDLVSKRVAELIEAGKALKPDQFAKERAGLRDDLLTALGLDYEAKKLADAAALGLAKAIVERPQLTATLKLWADGRKK